MRIAAALLESRFIENALHPRTLLNSVTLQQELIASAACRQTSHMRIAAALLESYERQVQSVEGALKVSQSSSASSKSVAALC